MLDQQGLLSRQIVLIQQMQIGAAGVCQLMFMAAMISSKIILPHLLEVTGETEHVRHQAQQLVHIECGCTVFMRAGQTTSKSAGPINARTK